MKKQRLLLIAVLVLVLVLSVTLTACSCKHKDANHDGICDRCEESVEIVHDWNATTGTCPTCGALCEHNYNESKVCTICGFTSVKGTYVTLKVYAASLTADLGSMKDVIGNVSDEVDSKVLEAYNAGAAAIGAATSHEDAKSAYDDAIDAMLNEIPLADGIMNFSGLSTEDKTEILGIIEGYCLRNGMLGLTLYENGGYVMYNERVQLGAPSYISGYGFGTLAEGDLTADLATENNTAWKRYYHTVNSSDPGTANMLDDQGSEVDDFYSYFAASYYTTFMNSTKDGYDWVPELAVADPEPVGELNSSGQTDTWRFEIRSGLKYSTNSKIESRKAFDGREVQPEDFITAFKLLLNQANGLYRGGELANQTGASSIKGAAAYYKATAKAEKGIPSEEDYSFDEVGVKIVEEDGKTYFQYTLGAPVTAFYARYYITSSLYMPVPAEFIELVSVDNYLGYNSDKTETPVDNSLSLGAYVLEQWDSDQQVVYKKNPNYVYADSKYKIQGIHINILKAAQSDTEAVFKEFIAGKIDASSIPDTKLAEYVQDKRTHSTTGDSCFKLNMNALTQEEWIKLFGENGTYAQTKEEDYWECEPALGNKNFRLGLSYALNRLDLATVKGVVPSADYFSSNYMSDPVNGISYNATDAHKNAIAFLLEGTDGYGYSVELARNYFRIALQELEAEGKITPGSKENPTVIELEVAWMYPANETGYHKYVKQYWEDAFNHSSVSNGRYKLECKFWVGNDWSDVYYTKMLTGQYDIGFGSISGNTLDPLSFFNINSTDVTISNQFTLNWAMDTNTLVEALIYNGQRWTFDALYMSTQENAIVSDGAFSASSNLIDADNTANSDGSYDVTIKLSQHELTGELTVTDLVAFGGDYEVEYDEVTLYSDGEWAEGVTGTFTYDEATRVTTITISISKDVVDAIPADHYNQGIDVYYDVVVGEGINSTYKTAVLSFINE